MRILVANIPLPLNRYLIDLNSALSKRIAIVQDHNAFWRKEGDFDVVHFHFPEYMTYEIENAYQTSLSDELIASMEDRLRYWANRSSLVITRHNLLAHNARHSPRWERLYETVYRYIDGVVHFAKPSIKEFSQRYSKTNFLHGHPLHCIIPHHNYISLPNEISREEARSRLGISMKARVVLVFGAIRNDAERSLVLDSFRNLGIKNKLLLVSCWREKLPTIHCIRLRNWYRKLNRIYFKWHPHYNFNYGFVAEEDVQLYLNSADVLLIPRFDVLNSGNAVLAMTFGKVVVGPDSFNLGKILEMTKNVVFNPNQPNSAVAALERAMHLAEQNDVGPANRALALREWSVEQCADSYLTFYLNIINRFSRQKERVL